MQPVLQGNRYQLVVGQYHSVQKLKQPVLCGLHCGDVAWKRLYLSTKHSARLAKQPPVVSISRPVVLLPFRLDPLQQPLVGGGVALPCRVGGQPEHIYHQHVARRRRQVTPVAVLPDMALKPWHRAQPKAGRLLAGHDEPRAEELHPPVA